MRQFRWLSQNSIGTDWKLYSGTVLLGTIYCAVRGVSEWRATSFRLRSGMETGLFPNARDAAKWLLGYNMRPIRGWKKHG
jgi:hypothetical protein